MFVEVVLLGVGTERKGEKETKRDSETTALVSQRSWNTKTISEDNPASCIGYYNCWYSWLTWKWNYV